MALSSDHLVADDVRSEFFKWIEKEIEFEYWRTGDYHWQLRCVGGPGSGKTTFSALLARRLRESNERRAVANVFIQGIPPVTKDFICRFLYIVHAQLSQYHGEISGAVSTDDLHSADLAKVDSALARLLTQLEGAFLIVDDVDACGYEASIELEKWLRILQKRGLRILTTSRIGLFKLPFSNACDSCSRDNCRMWWACDGCNQSIDFTQVCHLCFKEIVTCSHCGGKSWFQPFDRLELKIGNSQGMLDFVSQELQLHHGDLGLLPKTRSSDWPPLTGLGQSLRNLADEGLDPSEDALRLQELIRARSNGNLALAKLQVESLREIHDADEAFASKDRLPPNVVLYFHDLVEPILRNGMGRSILRFVAKTRGAARPLSEQADSAESDEDDSSRGELSDEIDLDQLKGELQDLVPGCKVMPTMQVLFAVRGLLALRADVDNVSMVMEAFHDDFFRYLTQGYHEQLK